MGNEINKLREVFESTGKRLIPTQVEWGVVDSVNWEDKTCNVKGLTDGLLFYNVSLGLSDYITKPIVGSKCLIGSINNSSTNFRLLEADHYEKKVFVINDLSFELSEDGFELKKGEVSLKNILTSACDLVKNATITTPAGPGFLSPNDQASLENLKSKIETLFN